MSVPIPQFLDVGTGHARRRIAVLHATGVPPSDLTRGVWGGPWPDQDFQFIGHFWLQGFMSDMVSTKATALAEWAAREGQDCTRFDYSGHGQSEGRFEDGTIGRWLEDARAVFEQRTVGSQIVIGSSMGGYLALLLLRQLQAEAPGVAARIKALVLIAPAWNMTEDLMWAQMPEDARAKIMSDGVWMRPSLYGDPYPITRGLIEDGRRHLIPRAPWSPGVPVTIIHGRLDPDVPFAHSQDLMKHLVGDRIRLVEVADGEHRLSRPQDIALMFAEIAALADAVSPDRGNGGRCCP